MSVVTGEDTVREASARSQSLARESRTFVRRYWLSYARSVISLPGSVIRTSSPAVS